MDSDLANTISMLLTNMREDLGRVIKQLEGGHNGRPEYRHAQECFSRIAGDATAADVLLRLEIERIGRD